LTINDTKYLQYLNETNAILKTYDIVAVKTNKQNIFTTLCSEYYTFDILTFDMTEKVPIQLKRGLVTEAIKKGIMFEINYSQAIEDPSSRRMVFSNAISIMHSTKDKGIIISSGGEDPFFHRSPHDIINLSTVLGISKDQALKTLSENTLRCIKRAESRRNFKGTIGFATVEEEKQFALKQTLAESKKKIKPNPPITSIAEEIKIDKPIITQQQTVNTEVPQINKTNGNNIMEEEKIQN